MKGLAKVVGIVQAKNEWPLLAISISHALMSHVDEVYVLNHASTDGSFEGLRHLERIWNGKLHVFNSFDERYWQAASANALIEISQQSSPEWIYVFDADEFLLTQPSRPLKEILCDVGPEYSVVRYQVQNWISFEGFDEAVLGDYLRLRHRSVPNLFIEMQPELYADEIWSGNLNFFDVPFPSKVIFRNDRTSWVRAGAHAVRGTSDVHTLSLGLDKLAAAHFPLLTRPRLEMKAVHGQRLVQDGFPPWHGWQNQMIYRFAEINKLDNFWKNHTAGPDCDLDDRTLPSWVVDDSFVLAIEPVIGLLEKSLNPDLLRGLPLREPSSGDHADTPVPFRTVVDLTRKFELIGDLLHKERDLAVQERDLAVQERKALYSSLSWRFTKPLRTILSYVKRRR